MNKQINLFWIALVLSTIIFTNCPPPPEAVAVTGVSLSQSEVTLNVNEYVALNATVSPENASNKNVSWSSSDETVATVDTNGLVKALKEGTATITVKTEDGEKTATCSVTVVISVTGVKLNYTQIYREQGESFILTATVEPSNASNKTVTWTTSNDSIATVNNGTVTMTGSTVWESATITATSEDGGKTATCTVTVIQKPTASTADANGFVTISAGSMPLNSDGSYHVTLTKAYMICDHEVTQKEWQDVMGNNPSYFSNPRAGEVQRNRPVEKINWYMAIAYCNKRSIKEGLTPCYSVKVGETEVDWENLKYENIPTSENADWDAAVCYFNRTGYRLPTEAEWEIAARGGLTGDVYAGTDDVNKLGDYAWYGGNWVDGHHEVKKKKANGYGLYDMSGNVCEWCWDWSGDYANGDEIDPTGALSGTDRVGRGGRWDYGAIYSKASFRGDSGDIVTLYTYSPNARNKYFGFRLVRTVQ